MKIRLGLWSFLGLSIALIAVLMSAGVALAQSSDAPGPFAALAGGVFLFCMLAFIAAMYVYMSLALSTIATKTGTPNPWLAWIPIANIFLMLEIAKKPGWWFILFLVPLANIVVSIIVWMEIAKARKKPDWWGILIIVPLVGVVVPGYLAWAD